eukprot:2114865-Alexandrium_andersonii.AAC.1
MACLISATPSTFPVRATDRRWPNLPPLAHPAPSRSPGWRTAWSAAPPASARAAPTAGRGGAGRCA